jgi:hypothetical protein
MSRQQRWTDTTASEIKCFWLHLSARLSARQTRLNFSANTTIEAVGLSQAPVDGHATLAYWAHISSM